MFELTWEEQEQVLRKEERADSVSRSQNVILKRGSNAKYKSFAFTEQGVAMLSSVLKSSNAVLVNIAIMRAFVRMRAILAENADLALRLAAVEQKLTSHDRHILSIVEAIRQLAGPDTVPPKRRIGLDAARGR